MKYILFVNNVFNCLASTEEKLQYHLGCVPNAVSKEIDDTNFKAVAIGLKSASLVDGNIVYEEVTAEEKSQVRPAITDSSEAQKKLTDTINNMIDAFKERAGDNYESDSECTTMVAFLESIDVTQKTSWDAGHFYIEYIYDLPGCPETYLPDLKYN